MPSTQVLYSLLPLKPHPAVEAPVEGARLRAEALVLIADVVVESHGGMYPAVPYKGV
ncbi:MAG: hypothetical protein F7B20_04985 [Aeropyrum sp.]|nr:hypothetical protein [Aeropyrum sp.]MCE4615833.1 hypothetical protein [Aeropyrum sp.]